MERGNGIELETSETKMAARHRQSLTSLLWSIPATEGAWYITLLTM